MVSGSARKVRLFIGSSSEALDVAHAIHQNLEGDAEITVWSQADFALSSRAILDVLLRSLDSSEYGVFVLTPDDLANMRDRIVRTARDNVIFELGLFLGRLGRDRVFFVVPAGRSDQHLPTDLAGIHYATYDNARADRNLMAALGPACARIREKLRLAGARTLLTEKPEIDDMWRDLLANANQRVRILAGDSSWAERDHELMSSAIHRGVRCEVLCRPPLKHILPKRNLELLLAAGANVHFFEQPHHHTAVRGLIVDGNTDDAGVALRVRKSPRGAVKGPPGRPGDSTLYVYSASYYYGAEHKDEIGLMRDLFDSLYAATPEACALTPVELSIAQVAAILASSGVKQYEDVTERQTELLTVSRDEMLASCRFVKLAKLYSIKPLVNAFAGQEIPAFRPCRSARSARQRLLLPPIVERHEKGFVVVDGTHRLFEHFNVNGASSALCLCVRSSDPLPSTPVPFDTLALVHSKPPRAESFVNYDPDRFRRMKSLDDWLSRYQVP